MALITDYCHACHQRRPCDCDKAKPFPSVRCWKCGGWSNNFLNPCTCSGGPTAEPTQEEKKIIAPPENVVSLTRERFKRDTNPNNHAPRAALEQALGAMNEMQDGKRVTHCIVLFAIETDDGLCGTRFIQAGSADHHGQMGLIAEAQCLLREAE